MNSNLIMLVLSISTILVPPKLTAFPQSNRDIPLQEDLVVSCMAEGRPLPYILWMHNDAILTGSEEENITISTFPGRSELRVDTFTNSSTGKYSCNATNSIGFDTRTFYVNIIGEFVTYYNTH